MSEQGPNGWPKPNLLRSTFLKGLEINLEESGVDLGETQNLVEEKITDDKLIEDTSNENILSENTEINKDIDTITSGEIVANEDNPIKNN